MRDVILVINAGSSSIKFSVFDMGARYAPSLFLRGQIEGIATHPRLVAHDARGELLVKNSFDPGDLQNHDDAMSELAGWLRTAIRDARLVAAGHRVVHGGPMFAAPVLVDDEVLDRLEPLSRLAPLHQPANLSAIRALRGAFPKLP